MGRWGAEEMGKWGRLGVEMEVMKTIEMGKKLLLLQESSLSPSFPLPLYPPAPLPQLGYFQQHLLKFKGTLCHQRLQNRKKVGL